jgi:cellulose 1,4-beta-cellobiosidase
MKFIATVSGLALLGLACASQSTIQTPNNPSGSNTPIPVTTPSPANASNPFHGATMMKNPDYVAKVEGAAKNNPEDAATILKVKEIPTAVWLDSIAAIPNIKKVLTAAEKVQTETGKTLVTTFVVYDLPNRDCSAKASAGELSVEQNGEQRYKTEFIDKIAEAFAAFPKQRVVAIVEPDSLPNLATNLEVPKCAASDQVYRNSVAYAVAKLQIPNVTVYLDAAHAGWLGWEGNRQSIASIYKDVLARAGGSAKIRGFATNVSNYNTVSGKDGETLGQANPCPDEGTYITELSEALKAEGITDKKFIIDTARNGKVVRSSWGNWCNIKGAGMGPRPQVAPSPLVDAYVWVKPPGESDGTSDEKAARFDSNCKSEDSMPNAPEAGQWFHAHFLEMVKNAEPKL